MNLHFVHFLQIPLTDCMFFIVHRVVHRVVSKTVFLVVSGQLTSASGLPVSNTCHRCLYDDKDDTCTQSTT